MIYTPSILAILLFSVIVITVLAISVFFARQSGSSKGYFAAGGTIPWSVNGIAFAGDYLSAASFLGICGMIAVAGYDGFLYSIGYLAGWIVALFVVAEPLKRLGKYTFADALDSKYNYRGIRLMAGISTLVVSIFYLIPQMVGAGALVTPLLGFPHYVGVIMVGSIVIFIVATAGMKSTTYVQFIKGALLIVFSTILVFAILNKGLSLKPGETYHDFIQIEATVEDNSVTAIADTSWTVTSQQQTKAGTFVQLEKSGVRRWFSLETAGNNSYLNEALSITKTTDGSVLYNGEPKEKEAFFQVGHLSRIIVDGKEIDKTGPLGPFKFLSTLEESEVVLFNSASFSNGQDSVSLWYQSPISGKKIMRPGLKFKVDKGSTITSKMDFVSLMLALFFGTSALPHVLIRYYTVPSPRDARKSTILAIVAIGFFYILTMYIGLGAMVNGVLDVQSSNMSAPLLAKAFGIFLFAIISAIAFATVLGTVSGLIVAAAGAVAHDLAASLFPSKDISDKARVVIGKTSAISVGVIAIFLGIIFKGMNVSFLVGWAFSIAASANFPAIIMMLFWKKTTAKGIVASVGTGMLSALLIILLSPSMFERYGLPADSAFWALDNPAIISIPISFAALIIGSLLTQKQKTS
ncbi:MAG: cation acetate symporter [Spirochaetales bacterium]|nr:cation acetate symporter [Spirochaetales bacterium]